MGRRARLQAAGGRGHVRVAGGQLRSLLAIIACSSETGRLGSLALGAPVSDLGIDGDVCGRCAVAAPSTACRRRLWSEHTALEQHEDDELERNARAADEHDEIPASLAERSSR